jgi:hypothetical protein
MDANLEEPFILLQATMLKILEATSIDELKKLKPALKEQLQEHLELQYKGKKGIMLPPFLTKILMDANLEEPFILLQATMLKILEATSTDKLKKLKPVLKEQLQEHLELQYKGKQQRRSVASFSDKDFDGCQLGRAVYSLASNHVGDFGGHLH